MPARMTFAQAKKSYESRFPKNKLVAFDSTLNPCTIFCYKHGAIDGLNFRNLKNSKFGCPECGRESRKISAGGIVHTQSWKLLEESIMERSTIDSSSEAYETYNTVESTKTKEASTKPLQSVNTELSTSNIKTVFYDNPDELSNSDFILVPYYSNVGLAAGAGCINGDTETASIPLSLSELKRLGVNPNNVVCCRVHGDSMEPILKDGAMVGINTAETRIKSGKIYAFVHEDGLARIKTLVLTGDKHIKIYSNNYSYESEIVDPDSIRVIGRLFWASTTF